ncbi:RNA-processing protein [Candidatus Woesearchaeota archaeon]|nr:RNA-processing protein [Candidatus Woesearchaeota archaeon]
MAEFSYHIKIPHDRIAVLIGKQGEVKKQIEEATKTKIEVDSKEGDVTVSGQDALLLYETRDLIKAIGRGFNPEIAMLLLKQDYAFEVISLPEFEKPTQFRRIKGRIIGKEGKSRRLIEEYTDTYISVFGKTVSLIGRSDTVSIARKAIEMLLKGSPHSNVYRWLEKMRRELKRREFEENVEDFLVKDEEK